MASRKGSYLERDVERIFRLVGLEPKVNINRKGYEIDVCVDVNGYSIIVECKAYETGGLHLVNLIHQWESKNKEINADKILLVIIGKEITRRERELADKYNIALWDEDTFEEIKTRAIEDKDRAKMYLLENISKNIPWIENEVSKQEQKTRHQREIERQKLQTQQEQLSKLKHKEAAKASQRAGIFVVLMLVSMLGFAGLVSIFTKDSYGTIIALASVILLVSYFAGRSLEWKRHADNFLNEAHYSEKKEGYYKRSRVYNICCSLSFSLAISTFEIYDTFASSMLLLFFILFFVVIYRALRVRVLKN